jgi:hypothetical protein
MKNKTWFLFSFLLFIFGSCGSNEEEQQEIKSENDIDAARNFIQSSLNGEYKQARNYMLKDSANMQYFDAYERNFTRLDGEERRDYREATINIHQVKPVSDSVSVIIYSNSFKKDHDTLKVVKIKDEWLVDFKYLFQNSSDTLETNVSLNADSLP